MLEEEALTPIAMISNHRHPMVRSKDKARIIIVVEVMNEFLCLANDIIHYLNIMHVFLYPNRSKSALEAIEKLYL
jgi:hypothetical protein